MGIVADESWSLDRIILRTIALRQLRRDLRGHVDDARVEATDRLPNAPRPYVEARRPRKVHPWRAAEAARIGKPAP
jgi:hypothetical protein